MSSNRTPMQATLIEHLRRNASRYFDDLTGRPARVALLRSRVRRGSAIYRLELSAGSVRHRVLAKSSTPDPRTRPALAAGAPPDSARPRIWGLSAPETRNPLEHAALTAIYEHFSALADPRFEAIRVLDLLPNNRAIIMEHSASPSLRKLLIRGGLRPGSGPSRLDAPFRNAGAWLRHYHRLSTIGHARDRRTQRDEFIESVHAFARYLTDAVGNAASFGDVATRIEAAAREVLPSTLPLGVAHADYAPRNVLVAQTGAVCVIDTVGRWRVPIYHDIASFLISLDVVGPRTASRGLLIATGVVRRYQQEFLRGYFPDEPVPLAAIRLFMVESLLDKWTSAVHAHRRARGLKRVIRWCELAVKSRHFRRSLESMMSGVGWTDEQKGCKTGGPVS